MTARPERLLVAVLAAVMIGFVALIIASPWLVRSIIGDTGDWRVSSEIGEAYGGVSAILSGLAFCGIAVSLILQWRQVRLTQSLIAQERHFELSKLSLERPELIYNARPDLSREMNQQWVARNLWVALWVMRWDMGTLTPAYLRGLFDDFFRDSTAREWWAALGAVAWASDPDRRHRRFYAIAEQAFRDAAAASVEDGEQARSESTAIAAATSQASTPAQSVGPYPGQPDAASLQDWHADVDGITRERDFD